MTDERELTIVLMVVVFIALIGVLALTGTFSNVEKSEFYDNVTKEYSDESYEGYNLFANRIEREVYLMTNDGDIKKQWDVEEPYDVRRNNYPLILAGGDLIHLNYKGNIARYDNNSSIVWKNENLGHHDAGYYNDTLVTFSRENVFSDKIGRLIQDDVIKQLDPDTGEYTGKNVSLYNVMVNDSNINISELYEENLLQGREVENGTIKSGQYRASNDSIKLFHANSITVLKKDYGGVFEKGNMLLSLRNIDKVVLLDWEDEEIVWSSEIDLDRQHHPTMTSDGNILIYDNGWETRNYTRVIEITRDNEIVWEYKNEDEFYSKYMGSAQELPNGNVLIAESGSDRAFEVNRDGEIVWEIDTRDDNAITTKGHGGIFRLTRFDSECIDKVIEGEVKHSRLCN